MFVLLNDDFLVMQRYLLVWELIWLCPHLSRGKATSADACVEVGCGYCESHKDTGPPWRSDRRNSFWISWTTLSNTGFLAFPTSMVILWCFSCWSSASALNPEARSVRTTAGGPSSGLSWAHRRIIASRSVWCRSSYNRVVAVKEVTHSRSTSTSCLEANETPTASGGRKVDCSSRTFGVLRKAAHCWQALDTWSMA